LESGPAHIVRWSHMILPFKIFLTHSKLNSDPKIPYTQMIATLKGGFTSLPLSFKTLPQIYKCTALETIYWTSLVCSQN